MLRLGLFLALIPDYKIVDGQVLQPYFSAEEYFNLEKPILS